MTRSWDPQADGTGDRPLVRALVAQRPRRIYGRCFVCGAPCHGRACRGHKDLLAKDPHYIASTKGRAA